jgi:hypothetical protein
MSRKHFGIFVVFILSYSNNDFGQIDQPTPTTGRVTCGGKHAHMGRIVGRNRAGAGG